MINLKLRVDRFYFFYNDLEKPKINKNSLLFYLAVYINWNRKYFIDFFGN